MLESWQDWDVSGEGVRVYGGRQGFIFNKKVQWGCKGAAGVLSFFFLQKLRVVPWERRQCGEYLALDRCRLPGLVK